ncbi:MAG: hypothetical protein R3E66_02575 [bacterium]
MVVKVSTSEMMLDALIENPNIVAALMVDDRGYIIDKRGHSAAIRDEDVTEGHKKSGTSNLYIVRVAHDYLIVVFDERLNFERLKTAVDGTLAQFEIPV